MGRSKSKTSERVEKRAGAGVDTRTAGEGFPSSPRTPSQISARTIGSQPRGKFRAVFMFLGALVTLGVSTAIGYHAGQRFASPNKAASELLDHIESQNSAREPHAKSLSAELAATAAGAAAAAAEEEKAIAKAAAGAIAAVFQADTGATQPTNELANNENNRQTRSPPFTSTRSNETTTITTTTPISTASVASSSQDPKLLPLFELFERNERAGIQRMDAFYKDTLAEAQRNECLGFFQMRNVTRSRYTAQCFQDFWLWQFVIGPLVQQNRLDEQSFTYIDVGAHHYKTISNLYFFDKCLGFRGVCAEPLELYQEKLRTERRCELLPTCASDKVETVRFRVPADNLGRAGRVDHAHAGELTVDGVKMMEMECRPLREPLERAKIDKVLIMSLDVEGAELKVFRGASPHPVGLVMVEKPGRTEDVDHLVREFEKDGYWHLMLGKMRPVRNELIFVHASFPMSRDELERIPVRCACPGCELV